MMRRKKYSLIPFFQEPNYGCKDNYNQEFTTEIEEDYAKIFSHGTSSPENNVGAPEINPFLNDLITSSDILGAIHRQNITVTSFDDDNIHPCMIKQFPPIAIAILEKIFNLCLTLGVWVWDTANGHFHRKATFKSKLKNALHVLFLVHIYSKTFIFLRYNLIWGFY